MATENDLQDNIGDGGQIHSSGSLATGKIKVALVDPTNGTLKGNVRIDWNTTPTLRSEKSTDDKGEVEFDIPNNATRAEITVDSPGRVFAVSFVFPHSISTVVFK